MAGGLVVGAAVLAVVGAAVVVVGRVVGVVAGTVTMLVGDVTIDDGATAVGLVVATVVGIDAAGGLATVTVDAGLVVVGGAGTPGTTGTVVGAVLAVLPAGSFTGGLTMVVDDFFLRPGIVADTLALVVDVTC